MKIIAARSLAAALSCASLLKIAYCAVCVILATGLLTQRISAQTESRGTIVGRVSNETSGQYLQRARISIPGTSLEAFTDDLGNYSLSNVPAGPVTLSVF